MDYDDFDHDLACTINDTREAAPSMKYLFSAISGNGGFIFFIVFMTLLSLTTLIVYIESFIYIDKKITASRRKVRLLIVMGIFPFMSVNALLSLYMPQSHLITYFTSTIYFSLALYQFLGLIFDYYGGKPALLELLKDKTIPLAGPPLTCCCYCCIPPLPITPRNLRIVKSLVLQVTIVRPVVLFIGLVTWADGIYVPGSSNPTTVNFYIQLLSTFSTLFALWAIIMFVRISKGPLSEYRVTPKFLIIQMCLITVTLQAVLIAILTKFRVVKCTVMFRALDKGNYILDTMIVIEMFLFMVASRYFFRSRRGNEGTLLDDDAQVDSVKVIAVQVKEIEVIEKNGNSNYNNNGLANTGYNGNDEVDITVVTEVEAQDIEALSSSNSSTGISNGMYKSEI